MVPARVTSVEAFGLGLPLRKPMRLASEIITVAENLFVRVTASDGTVGWGEAASAPTMTGEVLPGMLAVMRRFIGPALLDAPIDDLQALEMAVERSIRGNTGAKSAISMALYDLVARQRALPLHALLGRARRESVPALAMLGSGDAVQDATDARASAEAGYRHFKLKVGGDPSADARSLAAVRKAIGPRAELTADANMAWSVAQGLAFLRATQGLSLAYLEQPLADDDLAGLPTLTGAGLGAIATDEGIHEIRDIDANAAAGVRWFGLKLIKLGSYRRMANAMERCAAVGGLPILACKIAESSVGVAALAHLAVTMPAVETGVSFTHGYLQNDVTAAPVQVRMGSVTPSASHGHGIEVDEARMHRFRIG